MEEKKYYTRMIVWMVGFVLVSGIFPGSLSALHDSHDPGDVAELVGFMGKKQEYALVIFNNMEGERCGLFSVLMVNPSTRMLYPVILRAEEGQKEELTECLDAFSGKKYKDVYTFYLSKAPLPPGVKEMMSAGFVSKTDARKLEPVKSTGSPGRVNKKYTTLIAGQTAAFEVNANKPPLTVAPAVLKVFKTVKPYDFKKKKSLVEIKEGKVVLTGDDCSFKEVRYMDVEAEIPVCETCKTCEDRCYIVAAQLRFKGTATYGKPFFVLPHMVYPYYKEKEYVLQPPGIVIEDGIPFSIEVYATSSGQLIAVGAFVHDPQENATYFPVTAVHPGQ